MWAAIGPASVPNRCRHGVHSKTLPLPLPFILCKVKVKCTLVQALRLCTGCTAHSVSRGIALLFLDHGTRREWGVSVTPRPLFTPGKTRYPLSKRLGVPQGWSGQVRKISPPTGIRYPDRSAPSQSLYRLSYPAHLPFMCYEYKEQAMAESWKGVSLHLGNWRGLTYRHRKRPRATKCYTWPHDYELL